MVDTSLEECKLVLIENLTGVKLALNDLKRKS